MTFPRGVANIVCVGDYGDLGPTAAQGRVLLAISRIQGENGGWPVTVRSVCDEAGLASISTVHAHLHGLIRAGWVEQSPYDKGGYRLSESGVRWVERRRERMAA